jgi:hypothetical protein
MGNPYKILVGQREEKSQLGRPCRRWETNIKMYIKETGLEGVAVNNLAQGMDRRIRKWPFGKQKDGEFDYLIVLLDSQGGLRPCI